MLNCSSPNMPALCIPANPGSSSPRGTRLLSSELSGLNLLGQREDVSDAGFLLHSWGIQASWHHGTQGFKIWEHTYLITSTSNLGVSQQVVHRLIIGLAAAKGERSPNSRNSFRCHLLYEQSRLLVVPRWFCCLGRREFPSRGCGWISTGTHLARAG